MKVALTFTGLFILSVLFLGFQDLQSAMDNSIPIQSMTDEQSLWARKFIPLYDTYYVDVFLFSDEKIAPRTIVYDLCQYFIILTLIYMLWERSSRQEVKYIILFFIFTIADLTDYFLTHNNPFLSADGIPVSFNTLSVLLYPLISIYIYFRYGHQ